MTQAPADIRAYCTAYAKIKAPAGHRERYCIQFVSAGSLFEHRHTWTIILN